MGISYNTSVVRDGLVLYLDAANPKSYPGTGTTWFDLTKNVNGDIQNGASFSNSSFIFDGVNDIISIPNSPITQFPHNSPWTIHLIAKVITQNTTFPGFIYRGSSPTSGVLLFYTASGSDTNLFFKHNNVSSNVVVPTISTFFYTITYSGSGAVKFYLGNSFIKNGVNMVSTDTSSNLFLGRGDAFGNVQIYSFMKYNKELSLAEINKNFQALRGRYDI
jgi:hypothetical protein